MTFQRVPNTILLEVRATLSGTDVENTFYFQKASTPDQGDVDAVVAAAADWWVSDWQPAMSGDYVIREFYARSLDSAVAVQASDTSHAGEYGDLASATPNNVSLAVGRRSGLTGRASRGRIYVAGIPENQVDNTNKVNSVYTGLITAALDALDTAMESADLTAVIVHRVSAGVPLATAVVYTLTEWVVFNLVVDSMRRRLPKGH